MNLAGKPILGVALFHFAKDLIALQKVLVVWLCTFWRVSPWLQLRIVFCTERILAAHRIPHHFLASLPAEVALCHFGSIVSPPQCASPQACQQATWQQHLAWSALPLIQGIGFRASLCDRNGIFFCSEDIPPVCLILNPSPCRPRHPNRPLTARWVKHTIDLHEKHMMTVISYISFISLKFGIRLLQCSFPNSDTSKPP